MTNTISIIFPGQGSQTLSMLSGFGQYEPQIVETFSQASEILGYDLWQLCQTGPQDKLDQTVYTQPVLLTAGVAVWQVLQSHLDIKPTYMAGHSLGEYTALVCAQAIDFETAIRLVALRGQLMQAAVPEGKGAMAAIIGLAEQQLAAVCQQAKVAGIVDMANFNSESQIVISGEKAAVDKAAELAKQAGAKRAIILPVSVPSHSSLMTEAAELFSETLINIEIKPPSVSVFSNVDYTIQTDPVEIKDRLIKQLYSPVRWRHIIQVMVDGGTDLFIETGPGKVLSVLNRRICPEITSISVNSEKSLMEASSYVITE